MHPAPVSVGDGSSLSAILQAVNSARAARPDIALALATLVNVEGSSYRQPGARLLVDATQRILAGAISGGCLEGDVAARAAVVCATQQAVLLRYDLREDLEAIWGFDASCDGVAHILLESLSNDEWLRSAHRAMQSRARPVLVTVFACETGSVAAGTHWLIDTANGNALPEHVRAAVRTGLPQVAVDATGRNNVQVLCEPLLAPVALHVIGAGRSAEAFATIGVAMGWQVTVIDHRAQLLNEMQLPVEAGRLLGRPDTGLSSLPLDDRTAVALLTHMFQIDCAWLASLLPNAVAYVGVLGSRNRASRMLAQLQSDEVSVTSEMQQRLFAPIGLDLGGESPESIALAGIAEIEAVLHNRPGGFLRSRQSPIHTRTPIPAVAPDAMNANVDHCAIQSNARA